MISRLAGATCRCERGQDCARGNRASKNNKPSLRWLVGWPISGSRPNSSSGLLVLCKRATLYLRVEAAPARSRESMQRMRHGTLGTHGTPGWATHNSSSEPRNAQWGMRLKSRKKFIQQEGPPKTRRQHGQPCLQPCHPLSRPPAHRVFPLSPSTVPGEEIVAPSPERIISTPRRWHEHHEKKKDGKKGASWCFGVHPQRRRTRETEFQLEPTKKERRELESEFDPTTGALLVPSKTAGWNTTKNDTPFCR